MAPAAASPHQQRLHSVLPSLQEVVGTLAPLERRAGSDGERRAAEWIRERLERAGARAEVQEEQFLDGYAGVIGPLAAAGAAAGMLALGRRTRRLGGALAAAVTAAMVDDISNGPRLVRRAARSPRITWNVVAQAGATGAERTLVLLAHHDAAPTGVIFDDRLQAWFGEAFPGVLERIDTSLPLWWALLAGPAAVSAGAARRRRALVHAGLWGSVLGAGVFADIARSPVSPGANDNLTAVAVLVALAERLRQEPPENLRVLMVSCGAEEVLQGGIHGFARRHFPGLDRDRTWFLNLETLGSPRLILVEGEGPVVMEDYFDRSFRDLLARLAGRADIPLRRGMRARNSTDAVIPSRAGYPTATLTSTDRYKALSNYHQMSDTPEHVNWGTVFAALELTEALARELGRNPWLES